MTLTVHVSTMIESFLIRYRLQLSSATTASALPAESTVSKYGCDINDPTTLRREKYHVTKNEPTLRKTGHSATKNKPTVGKRRGDPPQLSSPKQKKKRAKQNVTTPEPTLSI